MIGELSTIELLLFHLLSIVVALNPMLNNIQGLQIPPPLSYILNYKTMFFPNKHAQMLWTIIILHKANYIMTGIHTLALKNMPQTTTMSYNKSHECILKDLVQTLFTWSNLPRSFHARTLPSREQEKSILTGAATYNKSITQFVWCSCTRNCLPDSMSHTFEMNVQKNTHKILF